MDLRTTSPLLGLLLLALLPAAAEPLRVSVSTGWGMPLGEMDAAGNLGGGIMYELYMALGKELGTGVTMVPLPRKRIDQAISRGELDMRCFLNRSWVGDPDRYRWSGPIIVVQDLIVAKAGAASPARLEDMHGKSLGTVLGYVYPDKLQSLLGKQILREDAPTPVQALSKLALGRSDYAVVDDLVLGWYVKHQRARFAANPLVLNRYEVECAVPLNGAPVGQMALAALERLRKRGVINQIVARHVAAH